MKQRYVVSHTECKNLQLSFQQNKQKIASPNFFIPQVPEQGFPEEIYDNDVTTYRNAVHPTMSLQRVNQLMKKFGIVHRRVGELNEKGLTMHWRTSKKMINVGNCYYNDTNDTFYIRSSCNAGLRSIDHEDSNKNMAYMEVERANIDPRYDTISLSVRTPDEDYHKKKINTCDKHLKSSGQYTFFTVHNEDSSMRGSILYNNDEDIHKIDITGNTDRFIGFRIRFWCWSLCKKPDFSNKHKQIRFFVKISGDGVEDLVTHTYINIQSNPGRGAGVAQKRALFPDCTGPTQNPSTSSKSHFNNFPGSRINFLENGRFGDARKIFINVEIPKAFFDILGPGQARVEIEGLKRDINAATNWRVQDAINRKIAGNQDLLQENESLKTAISNLQHIVVSNNRQAECLQIENNQLRTMLEMKNIGGANANNNNLGSL